MNQKNTGVEPESGPYFRQRERCLKMVTSTLDQRSNMKTQSVRCSHCEHGFKVNYVVPPKSIRCPNCKKSTPLGNAEASTEGASKSAIPRKAAKTFENLTGNVAGTDVRSAFLESRALRRYLYALLSIFSIFVPLLFIVAAAFGTTRGGGTPAAQDRALMVFFALNPMWFVPLVAHLLLRRKRRKSGLILASVSACYILPLIPFGTWAGLVMFGLIKRIWKASIWVYAAKTEAQAMEIARSDTGPTTASTATNEPAASGSI